MIDKNGAPALRLEGDAGTGYVRLEEVTFGDGVIEFDARGKDVVQQSFLGIAFHGADVKTYDAIYFRPFNFESREPARRQRAVQYVSHPAYPWHRLREQFPGKYEGAVTPTPDPDGWFHVRVVVAHPKVSVFVNDAAEPCLVVDQLRRRLASPPTDARSGSTDRSLRRNFSTCAILAAWLPARRAMRVDPIVTLRAE